MLTMRVSVQDMAEHAATHVPEQEVGEHAATHVREQEVTEVNHCLFQSIPGN